LRACTGRRPLSVDIRSYDSTQLEATARLWSLSFRSSAPAESSVGSIEELAARIQVEIAAGWSAWLAFESDRLVGFLALKPEVKRLHQLFVLPRAQGGGVGAALLAFTKRQLPDGFWLTVFASNDGARRFYVRHGLTEGEHSAHPQSGSEIVTCHWSPVPSGDQQSGRQI
jgi:GNAT superfamily N-acetyltransferase